VGFERAQDGVGLGFEDDRRFAQGRMQWLIVSRDASVFGIGEELVAVVVDGVVGVFEGVAGEDKDHALFASDFALGYELLQSGEGDGRGGLAAYALGADLGLGEGNLLLAGLLAPTAGGAERAEGLAPRCRIADADRSGAGVGLDGDQFLAAVLLQATVEGVGAFGLDDAECAE